MTSKESKQKRSKKKIYSSESDDSSKSSIDFINKPGPSGCDTKDNLQVRPGAYVLVNVFSDKRSKGHYRYVGVCHQYDAEDGELKVA
ncbi:hypothetical protein AVEN_203674-1 [Araneus ventricosus]|uniref:Uncharacterized protein n=1 Tax=Araneus ventricosus TaxID=182803 RepID=A0A4Y2EZC4_ARAVE|nr:hypothetical protein AVEN_203674-1 [Araneus ventricosus]